MTDAIDKYYVVPYRSDTEVQKALQSITAFVSGPPGDVRLAGPDRVVIWRDRTVLYVSPGALSLIGYLEPDPAVSAAAPAYLAGPIMTPARKYPGPPIVASHVIAAADLPKSRVLILGHPND